MYSLKATPTLPDYLPAGSVAAIRIYIHKKRSMSKNTEEKMNQNRLNNQHRKMGSKQPQRYFINHFNALQSKIKHDKLYKKYCEKYGMNALQNKIRDYKILKLIQ
jgi:hypothetical protein